MLYDFECTVCQHIFEDLVNSDDPNPPCEECQQPTERLMPSPQHYTGRGTAFFDRFVKRYPELKQYRD